MCGGTIRRRPGRPAEHGLSPRVRGNPVAPMLRKTMNRSIPACAGEPRRLRRQPPSATVYPRVCGGTSAVRALNDTAPGLSPRVRGNRRAGCWYGMRRRSIPACAGEPTATRSSQCLPKVYPRVCGGTAAEFVEPQNDKGLSPRVRGNHKPRAAAEAAERSIPACAGEPFPASPNGPTARVYPRVCGGTPPGGWRIRTLRGLSPRVRGNRVPPLHQPGRRRSIPACAGEPPALDEHCGDMEVYPRVCGGTTICACLGYCITGLSPRVRGNPSSSSWVIATTGSIPACAGEPRRGRRCHPSPGVYPRVCGGTPLPPTPVAPAAGLSPRVRGNRAIPAAYQRPRGSIPACAGEPALCPPARKSPVVYPRVCGGTSISPLVQVRP